MLNKNSCQLGVNLALMLQERNRDLTPARGTLMAELTQSAYRPLNPNTLPTDTGFLPNYIADCAQGYIEDTRGEKSYQCSNHDALMDNYVQTLGKLVASHVQFARAVVYPKIQHLSELVNQALKCHQIKQPEDFFQVSTYRLPDVFSSALVDEEVVHANPASGANNVINFGDAVTGDFDLLSYLMTGDTDKDEAITQWASSLDIQVLSSHIFSSVSKIEAAMSLQERIDYCFVNFLFYRSLAFRQDLGTAMSVTQLVTLASSNRDHFVRSLQGALESYRLQIKQGVVLCASSQVAFSYLTDKRFAITVFEETFERAAAEGATIEQVFGFITQHASVALTTQMLKDQGGVYAGAWNTVRGLYLSHITTHRDSALKLALKHHVTDAIYHELSEEERVFFEENKGFEEETAKMVTHYVERLDTGCLDNTQAIFIDLIAGIAYRHSSAARIIREMVSLTNQDSTMEVSQAALLSTVKYVSDYLIEELSITN